MLTPTSQHLNSKSTQCQVINTDTPETLKLGLSFLIKRYLESQHEAIAQNIVYQLEKILQHSDCIGFQEERCTYHRLLNNWRAQCLRLK